jgi:hypothetical protein
VKRLKAERDKAHHRVCAEVHRLVLAEEDEAARFRRRLHIHIALISLVAVLTFMSVLNLVDSTVVVGATVGVNGCQEALDYVGRF